MRRVNWVIAAGFVLVGVLCLVMVGSGLSIGSMGQMGWMMGSMWLFNALGICALALLIVLLFVLLYRRAQKGAGNELVCKSCGQQLQKSWRICPYCGEKVEGGSH